MVERQKYIGKKYLNMIQTRNKLAQNVLASFSHKFESAQIILARFNCKNKLA